MLELIKPIFRAAMRLLSFETEQRVREFLAVVLRWTARERFRYSRALVSGLPKHINETSLIDRLLRFQIGIGEEVPFKGRTVLEIGSGPLLGWGMVAIGLGATKVYALEPAFNPSLLNAFGTYFTDHRRQVSRLLGPVDDVQELIRSGRIEVLGAQADRTTLPDASIDLIISNSVIEHILGLDEVLAELARIASPDCVQFHFIDLKDHVGGRSHDPFGTLYAFDPEHRRRMYRRRGSPINMLRTSDIERAFSAHWSVHTTVLFQDAAYPSIRNAHPYWKEHYSAEELGIESLAVKAAKVARAVDAS